MNPDLTQLGYPVPVALIDHQQRWEAHQVQRGIDRYTKEVSGNSIADTKLGASITKILIANTVAMVKRLQQKELKLIQADKSKSVVSCLLNLLSAEELAFITIKSYLTTTQKNIVGEGRKLTALAIHLGTNIKTQLDINMWRVSCNAEYKDGIRERDDANNILAKHASFNRRVVEHLRRRFPDFETTKWPTEVKLQIGTMLLKCMADGNPDYVVIKLIYNGNREEYRVIMTKHAADEIFDINQRHELAQPFLLPMLCPPKPWIVQ